MNHNFNFLTNLINLLRNVDMAVWGIESVVGRVYYSFREVVIEQRLL